jgi:hypothetical protein
MKIQTQWTFGNFVVTAETTVETAEPVGPLAAALMEKGFLQLLQRVPASNAEKALAGYDKRPAGFKRDSIPYNAENVEELRDAFGTSVEVSEKVFLPFDIVEVTENLGGEGATSRKMATEMWAKVVGTPMEKVLGLGEDATDEQGIEACHKFLGGLRQKKEKK